MSRAAMTTAPHHLVQRILPSDRSIITPGYVETYQTPTCLITLRQRSRHQLMDQAMTARSRLVPALTNPFRGSRRLQAITNNWLRGRVRCNLPLRGKVQYKGELRRQGP